MTDSLGPGSHVLYEDFVVPNSITVGYFITFSLYINNGHGAGAFFAPAFLDFSTPALNQQARVDIIKPSASVFSVAAADVLQKFLDVGRVERPSYPAFPFARLFHGLLYVLLSRIAQAGFPHLQDGDRPHAARTRPTADTSLTRA
jgi:hypothetical protein